MMTTASSSASCRSAGAEKARPRLANSLASQPMPRPRTRRPPLRLSRSAARRAVSTGWRKGTARTLTPRRMRSVWVASAARWTQHSSAQAGWSPRKSASKPRSSASRPAARRWRAGSTLVSIGKTWRPKPIRPRRSATHGESCCPTVIVAPRSSSIGWAASMLPTDLYVKRHPARELLRFPTQMLLSSPRQRPDAKSLEMWYCSHAPPDATLEQRWLMVAQVLRVEAQPAEVIGERRWSVGRVDARGLGLDDEAD